MPDQPRVIDAYDVAFFDLDGVIYLGPTGVPGAVDGVDALHALGKRVIFVTNNAARSGEQVAHHLRELGFAADPDDLVTSAQVAADILSRRLPAGSRILVAGTENLANLMRSMGFVVVASADDDPDAVIQGYDPEMSWPRLGEAALAVQGGAEWFATNADATIPRERGILPGLGAALNVVGNTVPIRPTIFGKPYRPMLDFALAKTGAKRPIFIGDRLDTDIEGANNAGMASMLVFSGVHGKADLLVAGEHARPTHLGADLRALLDPPQEARLTGDECRCGEAVASLGDRTIRLSGVGETVAAQLDALWALANLTWGHPGASTDDALAQLDLLR